MSALRDALGELPDAVFADLLEGEDAYLVVLDVPGAAPDSLEVSVETARLVVEGRRAKDVPPGFEYIREDRSFFFEKAIPLPPDSTAAGAEATLSTGVLEIRLPRHGATPETRIPVETA
ncbi:MAG: Hsp20/alpha crystallin family protein [Haloarculaceae archaeon]